MNIFILGKKVIRREKIETKNSHSKSLTAFVDYFKIFVLEKTNQNTQLKYEVDWIYSTF